MPFLLAAAAFGAGLLIYKTLQQLDTLPEDVEPTPPEPVHNCLSCGDEVKVVPDPRSAARWPSSSTQRPYAVQLSCPFMHTFCLSCINRYMTDKLSLGMHGVDIFPVRCPACPGQAWFVSEDTAEQLLDTNQLNDWKQLKYLAEIQTMYCPNVRCSQMLGLPEGPACEGSTDCPACTTAICIPCRTVAHPGLTCAQYAKSPNKEDAGLRRLAKKKHWRRCPRCQIVVERTEGCNHMTCRCGHHFCNQCGAEWRHGCANQLNCKKWEADASLYVPGRFKTFVLVTAKALKKSPAKTKRRLSGLFRTNSRGAASTATQEST